MTIAEWNREQRQRLRAAVVVSVLGCLLVVLWASREWRWALVLGAILLGTAAGQGFAWVLLTMWWANSRFGDGTQPGDVAARTSRRRIVSTLALPVGLLVAGLVLFIAGVVVDDDHLYGPGVSIGIAGAVLFAGQLVVYLRRR